MATPAQPPTDTPTSYIDPTFSLLNSTCLDLLLIELVPMAYRITTDLAQREEEWTGTSTKANRLSTHSNDASSTAAGAAAGTIGAGGTATVDEEESREAVFHRLESLGYRVGLGIVERYAIPCPSLHPHPHPHSHPHPFCYLTLLNARPRTRSHAAHIHTTTTKHPLTPAQFLPRLTPPHHTPRLHKIPLQRPLDAPLPQTNR